MAAEQLPKTNRLPMLPKESLAGARLPELPTPKPQKSQGTRLSLSLILLFMLRSTGPAKPGVHALKPVSFLLLAPETVPD